MSAYFTLPSFARAKKNKEDLEKTNPQNPILKDEDERFLEKQIEAERASKKSAKPEPTIIFDNGAEKPASPQDQQEAGVDAEQAVIPEPQPDTTDTAKDEAASPKKAKKKKSFDLPSQEEAEKATQGWDAYMAEQRSSQSQGDKRTWAAYLSTLTPGTKKNDSAEQRSDGTQDKGKTIQESEGPSKDGSAEQQDGQRTWAQYASSYVPSTMPSIPDSWKPKTKSKDKDAKAEPVYNEDGTVNEEKTKEKQEKEVSVLLDRLDMSTINNRVFALTSETQKIYDRFAQILRDTLNGVPTAYEDMEKLMREAGPQLEKQFKAMPPFVQTLVKSLPAKLSATLGPELVAAASEKPGADLKTRLGAASKKPAGSGTSTPTKAAPAKGGDKKKRRIPGLKGLISQEGAIAGMLRSVVNFLRVRFPFLASGTNVVMSLAVFILMFVFWYCHKRGKEVRLAKAAEAEKQGEEVDNEEDDGEDEDESEDEGEDEEEAGLADAKTLAALEEKLNQPDPSQVPLPDNENE